VTTSANPVTSDTSPNSGDIVVHVFGRTDVGRTREHNEDAFIVADLTTGNATLRPEVRTHQPGERGTLFMVADGMGGAAAGEIASTMAVEVVLDELRSRWCNAPTSDSATLVTALKSAFEVTNARIHRYGGDHPESRGLGTTATAAVLLGDILYVSQVGDSRAYLVREGRAIQITKDQSLMQKLVEAGEITAEEAEQSDRRNIILQALGPEPSIKPDVTHQQVRRGDTLILCSDGLSAMVRADEIARVAGEEADLVEICKRLIDAANSNGGPDNITVVAARFEGGGLNRASSSDEVGHRVYPTTTDETPTQPMERYVRRSNAPTLPTPIPAIPGTRESGPAADPRGGARAGSGGSGGAAAAAAARGSAGGRLLLMLGLVVVVLAAVLLVRQLLH